MDTFQDSSIFDLDSTAHRPTWSNDAVSAQLHRSTHGVSARGVPNQRIRKTKLDRFMGRLMTILNRLDQAVEVKVTIRPRSRGMDKPPRNRVGLSLLCG